MHALSSNEQLVLLDLCKSCERLTVTDVSRRMGLSGMGASKLLARLEAQRILASERIGSAKRFRIRYESAFVRRFLAFLLHKEAEGVRPQLRMWIGEIRRLEADIGIVFGSALRLDDPRDLDVLVVLERERVRSLNATLEELEAISPRAIHLVRQTRRDFVKNALLDPVVRDAARGVVAFGYDVFVEVMADVARVKYGGVVFEEGTPRVDPDPS